jgi:hypothetical protein
VTFKENKYLFISPEFELLPQKVEIWGVTYYFCLRNLSKSPLLKTKSKMRGI